MPTYGISSSIGLRSRSTIHLQLQSLYILAQISTKFALPFTGFQHMQKYQFIKFCFYAFAPNEWYTKKSFLSCCLNVLFFFIFFVVGLWPALLTSLHFILSYEAGFYIPTINIVYPPIFKIAAHVTVPA